MKSPEAHTLNPLQQSLILHFGEMGNRWGINRTVGQMLALLVFNEAPLNADEIAKSLGISRSNVSMGLKELQSWELVILRHVPGDRKDYFTVASDIWDIVRTLILQRRKRELEPTLTVLRSALVENPDSDDHTTQRMREMHDFMELIVTWSDDLKDLSRKDLDRLLRIGSGLHKVLEFSRTKE